MHKHLKRVTTDSVAAAIGIGGLALQFSILGVYEERLASQWMVASFGASITLLLACPDSPLARPYPAIVGNGGSALVGVVCWKMFGDEPGYALAIAAIGSIGTMSLLKAWHPPGGATALLAIVGGESIHSLGYWYPLCPILTGTIWLLLLARLRRQLDWG